VNRVIELQNILSSHVEWLKDKTKGERANLSGADLSGANLYRADLSRAKSIIKIENQSFTIIVTPTHARIGCEYRTHKEWIKMSQNEAVELGLQEKYYKTYRYLIGSALKQLKAQEIK